MRPGFRVNRDDVGPGLGEGREVGIGRRDHQVGVERLAGQPANGPHHVRSEGDVGDEMTVHDVEMDPVGAGGIEVANDIADGREIGRQDRRGEKDRLGHGMSRGTTRVPRGQRRAGVWQLFTGG